MNFRHFIALTFFAGLILTLERGEKKRSGHAVDFTRRLFLTSKEYFRVSALLSLWLFRDAATCFPSTGRLGDVTHLTW